MRGSLEDDPNSCSYFHSDEYLRHNQRRQEHLASLGLQIGQLSVLEVAAGIGDHTSFFLDRGCKVTSTDARAENLRILRRRYPAIRVQHLDLDDPRGLQDDVFEIIYCYGALYHLTKPAQALAFMSAHCERLLLLETCVSYGSGDEINICDEPLLNPTQSVRGKGCRPTRSWVHNQLKLHFSFVYLPTTQPNHEEFPTDWTSCPAPSLLSRSIWIASKSRLSNTCLVEDLIMKQMKQ